MPRAGSTVKVPMTLRAMIPVDVKLDWRAYWEAFKATHGDPVQWKGYCLFQDGWMYGMKYEGPEYPPPTGELALLRLQLSYWFTRKAIVKAERAYMVATVDELKELQSHRSLPLMHRTMLEEEVVATEVDVGMMTSEEGRLGWLSQDLRDCDEHMAEIQDRIRAFKK